MTEEEFKAEMKRRGWGDEDIEKFIEGYRKLIEDPELLAETPDLKSLPIDFLVCDPIFDEDTLQELADD